MTTPNLPDELLAKIIGLVARKCWWYMRPILKAGKRGRDIVYRHDVLKGANIYSLCSDPDDIHLAGRNQKDVNAIGRHRCFFERCLEARNPTAFYYEGLRLATQEDDIDGAIKMLQRNVPEDADATLAAALLCICNGYVDMAAIYLQLFAKNHYPLDSDEVRDMGDELLSLLRKYEPPHNNTYRGSFEYPECRGINCPPCALDCYMKTGPFKNVCNTCYLWWCARRISQML